MPGAVIGIRCDGNPARHRRACAALGLPEDHVWPLPPPEWRF
jgi:hypothetical protein